MGEKTGIEWADHTINFFMGCTKVSEGCKECYAERDMKRFGKNFNEVKKTIWDNIKKNLAKWEPGRVFVNSFSDTFHESITFDEVEEMMSIMGAFTEHQFLILTKRPHRMAQYSNNGRHPPIPPNVWVGTSIENSRHLDRLAWLNQVSGGNIKFVSFEPLLGPIDRGIVLTGIDWIIIGGESGAKALIRPMKREWSRDLIEVARSYNCKIFFKQWGGYSKCTCHGAWGCREEISEFPEVMA